MYTLSTVHVFGCQSSPKYKSISPELHSRDASHREYPGFYSVHVLLCTVSQRLQSVDSAQYTRIQLNPSIYSMGGFKTLQLGGVALYSRLLPESSSSKLDSQWPMYVTWGSHVHSQRGLH